MASRRAHLTADTTAVSQAAAALDAFSTAERLPAEIVWRLRVALDEILANIVTHGSVDGRIPAIEVLFRRAGEGVEVIVADDGPGFDPLAQPDPDVTLPLEARQPGGLGIALVKSLMDRVHYDRGTRNVLTIWKRIAPEGSGEP